MFQSSPSLLFPGVLNTFLTSILLLLLFIICTLHIWKSLRQFLDFVSSKTKGIGQKNTLFNMIFRWLFLVLNQFIIMHFISLGEVEQVFRLCYYYFEQPGRLAITFQNFKLLPFQKIIDQIIARSFLVFCKFCQHSFDAASTEQIACYSCTSNECNLALWTSYQNFNKYCVAS